MQLDCQVYRQFSLFFLNSICLCDCCKFVLTYNTMGGMKKIIHTNQINDNAKKQYSTAVIITFWLFVQTDSVIVQTPKSVSAVKQAGLSQLAASGPAEPGDAL